MDVFEERLIRLEERVASLRQEVEDIHEILGGLERDLQSNSIIAAKNALTLSRGEKLFWLIASSIVAGMVWLLKHVPVKII